MTHTPLQLRRAIDPIMGHNMIEVDMGKDWFALCQVGNVHTNNEEAEQQYGSLADAACTLFLAAPDLLAALKAVLPYLEHSVKFYRYQQAGHEFWPNREEAEGNIRDGEAALAKAKEVK